jgi:hypothetical protein
MTKTRTRYAVVCPQYEQTFRTREAAERNVAQVEQLGDCHGPHWIEERHESKEVPG